MAGLTLSPSVPLRRRRCGREVVSAISIRIPLSSAYAAARRFALRLSLSLLAVLAVVFGLQSLLYVRLLLSPLRRLQRAAAELAADDRRLGVSIPEPFGQELGALTSDLNALSSRLRGTLDGLEARVRERTLELETALARVKRLDGLLPICSQCKRIRDDRGYWRQVEAYISERSEAEFTHGVCPDCVRRLYPELDQTDTGDA